MFDEAGSLLQSNELRLPLKTKPLSLIWTAGSPFESTQENGSFRKKTSLRNCGIAVAHADSGLCSGHKRIVPGVDTFFQAHPKMKPYFDRIITSENAFFCSSQPEKELREAHPEMDLPHIEKMYRIKTHPALGKVNAELVIRDIGRLGIFLLVDDSQDAIDALENFPTRADGINTGGWNAGAAGLADRITRDAYAKR